MRGLADFEQPDLPTDSVDDAAVEYWRHPLWNVTFESKFWHPPESGDITHYFMRLRTITGWVLEVRPVSMVSAGKSGCGKVTAKNSATARSRIGFQDERCPVWFLERGGKPGYH